MIIKFLLGTVLSLIGLLIVLFLVYLFLTKPRKKAPELMKKLSEVRYAHRGLYGEEGIPENTLAAFKKACDAGFGMELDIHLSLDKKLVVMHDNNIKRMCGIDKRISESNYSELEGIKVGGTNEKIPLFSEMLETVGGKTPLVVEVKVDGDNYAELCKAVTDTLDSYNGDYCIESFDPRAVKWLRKNRPDIVRGQLAAGFGGKHTFREKFKYFFARTLMTSVMGRPDFIAYCYSDIHRSYASLPLSIWKPYKVVWTIRSKEDMENAEKENCTVIFEKFLPDSTKTKKY